MRTETNLKEIVDEKILFKVGVKDLIESAFQRSFTYFNFLINDTMALL